jgi:hypothetical protein
MNSTTRLKLARSMDYHQQLADHYSGLSEEARSKEATEGEAARATDASGRAVITDEEYLASLHADVAEQLRDVLGEGAPPAILGATSPIVRETGPIIEPRRRQVH